MRGVSNVVWWSKVARWFAGKRTPASWGAVSST
jgi:hypothetical protein